jgi:hypothetical protein
MNINFRYIYIGSGVLFLLLIIVFSSLSITYHSKDDKSNIPIDLLDNRTKTGIQNDLPPSSITSSSSNPSSNPSNDNKNVGLGEEVKYNKDAMIMGLHSIPDNDDPYINDSFREQIANLSNKFYYDNCKYQLSSNS